MFRHFHGPKVFTRRGCPAHLTLNGFEWELSFSLTGCQPRLLSPVYPRMFGCSERAVFPFPIARSASSGGPKVSGQCASPECSCTHLAIHRTTCSPVHSSISPYTHPSIHPSTHESLFRSYTHPSIHAPIYQSMCPNTHPPVQLSVSVYPFIHPKANQSMWYQFTHPLILPPPLIYPFTPPSTHLSAQPVDEKCRP